MPLVFVKILKIYIQVCMIVQLRLEIKKLIEQSKTVKANNLNFREVCVKIHLF